MSIATLTPRETRLADPVGTPTKPDTARRRFFGPGWPLRVLFIGFPMWWVIGASELACFAAALVMALELLHRRHIAFPRGFALWMMFLAFVVGGIVVLQVNVVGAVPGAQNTRYITWAYRFCWYLAATILMLYIGNLRRELKTVTIARTISWMFVTLTVGGLVGVLLPQLQFQSLLELVLPAKIDSHSFVRDLIHPSVAQLYSSDGTLNPRPSAPFPYTNDWGVNFACLLPFFVATWFGKDAGWRRFVGPVIFLASLVPVVQSQNRGLWLALLVMALFVTARSVAAGHVRLLAAVLGGVAVLVAVVAMTPLSSVVEGKLSGDAPSDSTRTNLGAATFDGVLATSPFVGVGTTRDVQGSFDSIASGATATCPLCSPPSLGTQGQLWLVMFCQGFIGLALYLGFFFLQFFRHLRLHSRFVTVGLCVLISHFATMPFYNAIGPAIFFVMAGVGLMWRDSTPAPQGLIPSLVLSLPPRRRRRDVLRQPLAILLCWASMGAVLGGVWQFTHGIPSVANVSIWLRPDPLYPNSTKRPETLDTAAQIASGARVLDAISAATGQPLPAVARSLAVSAVPNTRILELSFRADTARTATEAVGVAAQAVLSIRGQELENRQASTSQELNAKSRRLSLTVARVEAAISSLSGNGLGPPRVLLEERYDLGLAVNDVESNIATVTSLPVDAGEVVRPIHVRDVHGRWNVSLATGLLLGLLVGVAQVVSRDPAPSRARLQESWLRRAWSRG